MIVGQRLCSIKRLACHGQALGRGSRQTQDAKNGTSMHQRDRPQTWCTTLQSFRCSMLAGWQAIYPLSSDPGRQACNTQSAPANRRSFLLNLADAAGKGSFLAGCAKPHGCRMCKRRSSAVTQRTLHFGMGAQQLTCTHSPTSTAAESCPSKSAWTNAAKAARHINTASDLQAMPSDVRTTQARLQLASTTLPAAIALASSAEPRPLTRDECQQSCSCCKSCQKCHVT